jgi:hypothetical protein
METSRQAGTQRIKPTAVTQIVPTMNGQKPNFPALGCHSLPKIKSARLYVLMIGQARRNKAIVTMTIKTTGSNVMIKNVRCAVLSRRVRAATEGRRSRPSAWILSLVTAVWSN